MIGVMMALGTFGETESDARQQDRATLQARAIVLLADGLLTEEQIAAELGISFQTLWRWKKQSAFKLRLERAREVLDGAALRYQVAHKRHRVRVLNKVFEGIERTMDERAEQYVNDYRTDPDPKSIPGANTGLLIPGTDKIDRGLLAELRDVMRQAAIEVHQWDDGSKAPLQINITLRNEAERLAAKLGIPVEELYIEAEALLLEASNDVH